MVPSEYTQQQYAYGEWLAMQPFEVREHNWLKQPHVPYILKSAIRRRLNRIDPRWKLLQPVKLETEGDVVIMTAPLVVLGVERYGVGTAVIQREGKEGKVLPPFMIARNTAKAVKEATSAVLPRAARQFNIGWYMDELPEETKGNEKAFAEFVTKLAERMRSGEAEWMEERIGHIAQ